MGWPRSLLLCAIVAAWCGGCAGSRGPGQLGPRLAFSWQSIDGVAVDSSMLRGRVVVIHLFTVGSMAAQVDLAQLKAISEEYAGSVAVIGVSLDLEGRRLLAPWRRANDIGYIVVGGGSPVAISRVLGPVRQVPATLVLDARSRVRARIERQLAPGELESLVRMAMRPPVR